MPRLSLRTIVHIDAASPNNYFIHIYGIVCSVTIISMRVPTFLQTHHAQYNQFIYCYLSSLLPSFIYLLFLCSPSPCHEVFAWIFVSLFHPPKPIAKRQSDRLVASSGHKPCRIAETKCIQIVRLIFGKWKQTECSKVRVSDSGNSRAANRLFFSHFQCVFFLFFVLFFRGFSVCI